ncbi:glycosyltransferase [Geobacter sp.]|uniref:glycosyltransferase family 2 protein n=1 Tax=Geobacter sp. TaxID=46610 RepID=UPI00262B6CF4|nr:glycosyltransferase [Geobacter sp.]
MEPFDVDILLPVWNRPVDTRNCLVTLMATAPAARIILIDNGSDRETERLLEEFAEVLGERALYLKTSVNQGLVRSINRGLERAEASCVVIVRNTTVVAEGWLDPMLELVASRPEVGLVVPRLEQAFPQRREKPGRSGPAVTEVSHGSFAALLVRKKLLESIGGFDEELDGGVWCLKDYSRRALRAGFLTCAAEGVTVTCEDDAPLGSAARREETVRRSAATCETRWGRDESFCVYWPNDADPEEVRARFPVLLRGARMGHRFTVIVHGALHNALLRAGYGSLHRSIAIEPLPRFFAAGELRRIVARVTAREGETTVVAGLDGLVVPAEDARPFGWLEGAIRLREESCYRSAGA